MGGVNKKVLAVGAVTLMAMAAMAMVYYSAYGTSTITAKNIIGGVSVETSSPSVYSPSIFLNEQIAKVNITLNDPNPGTNTSKISYTVVFESPLLKTGAVRAMVIEVYKDNGDGSFNAGTDTRIGVMSPLTPSFIYNTTYDESTSGDIGSDGKNVTYFLVANGLAFKPGVWSTDTTKLGIKASVSLNSVS